MVKLENNYGDGRRNEWMEGETDRPLFTLYNYTLFTSYHSSHLYIGCSGVYLL
jgi:hypothetical protein